MKKTVLFLEQQSFLGGAQRVLQVVLNSLAADFDVLVTFPEHGPFVEALREKGMETFTLPLGKYTPGRKSGLDMLAFTFRSLICGLKLALLIRRRRIGLIYINGPRCLAAGALAAWMTRRPSLFHLHLILKRKLEIRVVKILARRVSTIVTCSRAAAEPLLAASPELAEKIHILYNPAPVRSGIVGKCRAEAPSCPAAPHLTIGVVARITEAKGQHILLNALARLSPEVKSRVRAVIVGAPEPRCADDIEYECRLRAFATQYGLEKQIQWTGYQPDPALYYASMDVLVQPTMASRGEGLGLAAIEAMQYGVPVISSCIGGVPEVIQDGWNGLLVPPEDEPALATALERFMGDESLREQLNRGARTGLDDRFSQKTFSHAIRNLVYDLCSPGEVGPSKIPRKEVEACK